MPPRSRGAAAYGLVAAAWTAFALGAGCSGGDGVPGLEGAVAVEATFGGTWCRRIEDPDAVASLVAERNALANGWQPAWTQLEPPGLVVRFLGAQGELDQLGIGGGQAQTSADGRQLFRTIDDATAARLVALVGGPPTGAPDRPCATTAPVEPPAA